MSFLLAQTWISPSSSSAIGRIALHATFGGDIRCCQVEGHVVCLDS